MKQFKTESKRLLHLMIHSIYQNREIFLRELISNASDAVDKLYIKSLTDSSIDVSKNDLKIEITPNTEERTLTVSDNGIGMNEAQMDKYLGTIARSGSSEFRETFDKENVDAADIIGQFGVGFYSAFMVADKVEVLSKAFGEDKAYRWTSDGVEGYSIEEAEKEGYGTDIKLYIKEDTDDENYGDYLQEFTVKDLVKRYSDYIRYPIHLRVTKQREVENPDTESTARVYEDFIDDTVVNSMIPIWTKKKSEVTQEEYNEFYKNYFMESNEPARVISIHADAPIKYDALLFIPSNLNRERYNYQHGLTGSDRIGISLYSSGVMIMDTCPELIDQKYSFVKGVVDSADLPLNISRETLQRNSQLHTIARRITKKVVSELVKFQEEERGKYEAFWKDCGFFIKNGFYEEHCMNTDEIMPLMLFNSAKDEKLITLNEYIENTPEDNRFHYAAGDVVERLKERPIVQSALKSFNDVLLLEDPVEEFILRTIEKYEERTFHNLSDFEGMKDLGNDEAKEFAEEETKANVGLIDSLKNHLSNKVKDVELSNFDFDSPSTLVSQGNVSLEMDKIIKATGQNAFGAYTDKILMINPYHKAYKNLKEAFNQNDNEKVDVYADILYNQALLVGGLPIEDPTDFAKKMSSLL